MNKESFNKVFPLGSHLCREPMPSMAELKKDMENLKRHGFNLVKLQEQWMVDEPLEGHTDFSRYEELIDYASRLDLGVYLGLTCEQAPGWLWRKHPDCRMIRRDGLPVAYEAQMTLPADGKPGPCYDHPGAMADQLRFIRKLVEVLGKYENIVVWNTWQEVAYWSERLAGQSVCFCPHTLAHFRRWLQEKYGDLDRLNRTWNTRYLDWEYVLPDRCAAGWQNLPQDVDWLYFMDNIQIGHVLRSRAQAIREADPLQRPVFCHKGSPVIGSGVDWTYARCQDFLGSSTYPAWGPAQPWDDAFRGEGERPDRHEALLAEMWNGCALLYDYIRSCNRASAPVWAAEFQGGPVSTCLHKGRVPSPEDIRRWMLTAVGSGVTAISFWVTRAEIMSPEVNGFSLLDSEGETTPRYEEAARIGNALNRYAELFGKNTWQTPEAAIAVNEWNYQFFQTMSNGSGHLAYSLRGWHRLLWEAGIPLDFVEISGLGEADLSAYKVLILPFPYSLSEEVAERLREYVVNGGNLICEAAPGRVTPYCQANRGEMSPMMRELFGVKQDSFTVVREPNDLGRWTPRERTWGEFLDAGWLEGMNALAGVRARANVVVQTFACVDAEPCLRWHDQIAGTKRQLGKGTAWLMGTCLGHNGTAYRDEDTRSFIKTLLEHCGVKPTHSGKLLLRKRVGGEQEAWFFTNPTTEWVEEVVDVSGWYEVEDLMGEKPERIGESVKIGVDSLDVRVLILKK